MTSNKKKIHKASKEEVLLANVMVVLENLEHTKKYDRLDIQFLLDDIEGLREWQIYSPLLHLEDHRRESILEEIERRNRRKIALAKLDAEDIATLKQFGLEI